MKTNAQKHRPIRTEEKLRKAAAHVGYEIEMLVYSAGHLGGWHSLPMTTPSGNEKNMALESFLLHFRNLRAFLCPSMQNVRVTDILASDFLDEPTPSDVGNTAKFVNSKERLDQMLAHLTYDRSVHIAAGEHGWRTDDML